MGCWVGCHPWKVRILGDLDIGTISQNTPPCKWDAIVALKEKRFAILHFWKVRESASRWLNAVSNFCVYDSKIHNDGSLADSCSILNGLVK